MDVYSLGVLLFVMLVGRKPWDSQRSHTLQYAVYSTAEAPGLADPGFLALSQPVRQLLLSMLAEVPEARPSTAQVLQHCWVQQGAQVGHAGSSGCFLYFYMACCIACS
jgi:serine/threonine protein kinase